MINSSVKGRLKQHIDFWDEIGCKQYIRNTILSGYEIPFIHTPTNVYLTNNKSAKENMSFVLQTISDLSVSGRVIEVPFQPVVVNPLTVSINSSGKKRLILDLRHVNKCIWKDKMRFEDVKLGLDYAEKWGYMFKFDLTSSYHHIGIAAKHQTFLGFSVKDGGRTKFFVFTVLPFGLSSAGFIFTKVLRVLVKFWRSRGIQIIVFLDDGWAVANTFPLAVKHSEIVRCSLADAGFLANDEKSVWVPTQVITWLGHIFNLKEGTLSITPDRISNLKQHILDILSKPNMVTARRLAQVAGKLSSMHLVIGNVARLMSRSIYAQINSRFAWDSVFILTQVSNEYLELLFWSQNIDILNIKDLFPIRQAYIPVYSDASDVACAAFTNNFEHCIAHKAWAEEEKCKSSTWRELRAIEWGLSALVGFLGNKHVQWFTDSKNCVSIVQNGSSKSDLQAIAISIFNICKLNSIVISPEWIPRDNNRLADYYSRLVDADDWGVSTEYFDFVSELWGPFNIDRFANINNRKTTRYNAKYWNPGCEAVDAFTQDWAGENNWLVPPICLVCKTIKHLLNCKATGVLVVPRWQSAAFWPLIFETETLTWKYYVTDELEFYDSGIFVLGNNRRSLLGSSAFKGSILAIQLDATRVAT